MLSCAWRFLRVFGLYADKRELQGMVPMGEPLDYSHRDELWIDYVADVADGFNATMTVASTLARPQADLLNPDDVSFSTTRGDILVMGGDQVYPSADYKTYRNRLIGPYRSALPAVKGVPPELFAIPGNHDWYDGLTVFCGFPPGRDHWWMADPQRRSYFALQLPHRWWLWGIDIQFESYLDTSQLHYFRDVIGPQLGKGDSIILCSATPSWIEANGGEPEAFENIDLLQREIAAPHGAAIRLVVAGDKHHYARYAAEEGDSQLITSVVAAPTWRAPITFPNTWKFRPANPLDLERSPPKAYHLAKAYPSRATSRRLRIGVLRLPFQNGSFWGLLGFFYLVIGWSVILGLRLADEGFATQLRTMDWSELDGRPAGSRRPGDDDRPGCRSRRVHQVSKPGEAVGPRGLSRRCPPDPDPRNDLGRRANALSAGSERRIPPTGRDSKNPGRRGKPSRNPAGCDLSADC